MSEDALETSTPRPAAEDDGVAVAPSAPPAPDGNGQIDLSDSSLYFNRELSWLDFNERVLQLAEDPSVPLLERLKFCTIYEDNLDEFYMVRVAGLHDQVEAGLDARHADAVPPAQVIAQIRSRVIALRERLRVCFDEDLRPASGARIRVISLEEASAEERGELQKLFEAQVFPALTPLVIGRGRPIPSSPTSRSASRCCCAIPKRTRRSPPGSRCRRSCCAAFSRSGRKRPSCRSRT